MSSHRSVTMDVSFSPDLVVGATVLSNDALEERFCSSNHICSNEPIGFSSSFGVVLSWCWPRLRMTARESASMALPGAIRTTGSSAMSTSQRFPFRHFSSHNDFARDLIFRIAALNIFFAQRYSPVASRRLSPLSVKSKNVLRDEENDGEKRNSKVVILRLTSRSPVAVRLRESLLAGQGWVVDPPEVPTPLWALLSSIGAA